jgi:hypothetical protein
LSSISSQAFNVGCLGGSHIAKNEPEDDERGVIINTASIAGVRRSDRAGRVGFGDVISDGA